MDCFMGSLNEKGFTESLQDNILPQVDHITYGGAFNMVSFDIGEKSKKLKDLELDWTISRNPYSESSDQDTYLGIVMKSSMDGEKRKGYPIQAIVGLDVSGSMNGVLSYNKGSSKRLDLAKTAIKLLVEKLDEQDSVGILAFNTEARTIQPLQKKSQIDQQKFSEMIQSISAGGGTTIINVFYQALEEFLISNVKDTVKQVEKRIILITDVMDDQFTTNKSVIENLSEEHQINTTIIGISKDFKSQYCESLVQIKGFNYFCAVEDSDLMKFVVDQFDYTFFPFAFNTTLSLGHVEGLSKIEVYGTPDYEDTNKKYSKIDHPQSKQEYILSLMRSSFPSQINLDKNGTISQEGGLILVKLNLQSISDKDLELKIPLKLKYSDISGENFEESFEIRVHLLQEHTPQQFLSDGLQAFFIVDQIRTILTEVQTQNQNHSQQVEKIQQILSHNPKFYKNELEAILQILQSRENQYN